MTTPTSSHTEPKSPAPIGEDILKRELEAVQVLQKAFSGKLAHSFSEVIELLEKCSGRVICIGMGKSGHIARKIQATLASIKIPSAFLHPSEALHGDLGMVSSGDVVLFFSVSGETTELLHIIRSLKQIKVQSVLITAHENSPLAQLCNVTMTLPTVQEADPCGLIPTCSSLLQLIIGDMLAVTLLERNQHESDSLHFTHPSGQIGTKTRLVKELLPVKQDLPIVKQSDSLEKALKESIEKPYGCAVIVDKDERILGCVRSTELFTTFAKNKEQSAEIFKTFEQQPYPVVSLNYSIFQARLELEKHPLFSSLIIKDEKGRIVGIVDKASVVNNH